MGDTVAEAVGLAGDFVKQVGEFGTQVADDAAPVEVPSERADVVTLSTSLYKARVEAASAKKELDALCAAAESATKEHNAALAKVREEQQDEIEA